MHPSKCPLVWERMVRLLPLFLSSAMESTVIKSPLLFSFRDLDLFIEALKQKIQFSRLQN